MIQIKFKAKITTIHHNIITNRSGMYFNHGRQEVYLERPMTPKYVWNRDNDKDTASSGDWVEITICKICSNDKRRK